MTNICELKEIFFYLMKLLSGGYDKDAIKGCNMAAVERTKKEELKPKSIEISY